MQQKEPEVRIMSVQNADGDDKFVTYDTDQKTVTCLQKILKNVREQHKKLDRTIEQITAELRTVAIQNRILLKDDIDTCSIQTLKMEKALAKEQADLLRSRKEGDKIQKQIKNEKQLQIQHIKLYENKMASIADKLRNGPKFYDRKIITAEISSLHEETRAIGRELASVEEELNEFLMKYRSVFKESPDNPGITEGGAFELSALKHVISQMAKDKQLHNSEDQMFCEELKNLHKLSSTLQRDLQDLKRRHSTLE